MKVFLDTNVIIDFYAQRESFFRPAAIIVDLAMRGNIELCVSSLSFVNAFYVLRKTYQVEELYDKFKQSVAQHNKEQADYYVQELKEVLDENHPLFTKIRINLRRI